MVAFNLQPAWLHATVGIEYGFENLTLINEGTGPNSINTNCYCNIKPLSVDPTYYFSMQLNVSRRLISVSLVAAFLVIFHLSSIAQKPCYSYPDRIDGSSIQRANISLGDSTFDIPAKIRRDYRIIGFSKPDFCSKRRIIFSVFTRDVEGNPYQCELGAFYSTSGNFNNRVIKYMGRTKYFVKASLIEGEKTVAILYFDRRWVRFSK